MLYANAVIPMVFLIVCFMSFPLMLQWYVRKKTSGRHLCAVLSKDKPLEFKLLKVTKDEFVEDKDDLWMLNTKFMKLCKWPMMFPKVLSAFQQVVSCSLVMRGRMDALDWDNPGIGGLSSKELPVILDPHWLINLVKGVGEEAGGRGIGKTERMMIFLSVGLSGICMILLFILMTKIG